MHLMPSRESVRSSAKNHAPAFDDLYQGLKHQGPYNYSFESEYVHPERKRRLKQSQGAIRGENPQQAGQPAGTCRMCACVLFVRTWGETEREIGWKRGLGVAGAWHHANLPRTAACHRERAKWKPVINCSSASHSPAVTTHTFYFIHTFIDIFKLQA